MRTTTHAKSSLLSARKTVYDIRYPVFRPMVWHVDAYARFSSERSVRAQPETRSVSASYVFS